MLRIYAEDYIRLGARILEARNKYVSGDGGIHPSTRQLTRDEITQVAFNLQEIRILCNSLNLPTSGVLLETRIKDPPQTARELDILVEALFSELKSKLFLFVPSDRALYYEWDGIVSDDVINAFPKSYQEIRAAGSCFAVGVPTACVFHSMRAAEIGLKALGAAHNIKIKSGKDIELAEWREILDGLNSAIQAIENLPNSTPNKEENLQFCSEAAAQFRFFKNGWRIRAAHARATYNESQAKEVIDHVRSFFEFLASRLRE